ncbi:MAG: glycoside hydrolase 43 family protein [Sphingomonas sanxanigenens]|uniref:Glycoside hydrolase 43 family protein n=1 Tax=Sphingomonas sanxanigenens TaxID=397260 RepID=A0A2W5CAQ9_9SPHN|nr:MAG: glycoside hydrolase 43 family protein [Sphingomonas sanxanigenens]
MRSLAAALLLLPGAAQAAGPVARFDWFDYRGADPADAQAKAGPGDYRNPILSGFYSDPSITRVGDDYYLVSSTFAYFPGIPVFHSRDLVNWTQIGNAIDRPGQLDFKNLEMSRAVFAPAISWHDGRFYIVNTCVDCGGNFVITAKDPKGPWSDPVWFDFDGIDPSLFFDEDGGAWLVNNGPPPGKPLYPGHRAIWIQRFDDKALTLVGPRTMLVDGGVDIAKKPIWIEGPHIYRKGGSYYLSAAEGGTAEGHSQTIFRSKSVTGPYEPGPRNPILTQRDLDPRRPLPITSAGHADLVTTPAGDWWSVFLATRPYRGDYYNIGRETFLLPVAWRDGWPEILPPGAAIPYVHKRPALAPQPAPAIPTSGAFAVRDDFSEAKLPLYWMQLRTPRTQWFSLGKGALSVEARAEPLGGGGQPSYLGRRLQHHWATITTSVRFAPEKPGDRAGLAIFQNSSHFYTLTVARGARGAEIRLDRRAGAADPADGVAVAERPVASPRGPVALRIVTRGDRIDFLYALRPGRWQMLAHDLDATLLSTRTAGGFIGATVGPYARSGD